MFGVESCKIKYFDKMWNKDKVKKRESYSINVKSINNVKDKIIRLEKMRWSENYSRSIKKKLICQMN